MTIHTQEKSRPMPSRGTPPDEGPARKPSSHAPALMTYAEAADRTTLSVSSLQRLAREGTIERVKVRGTFRLTTASVERFIRDEIRKGREKE